MNTANANRVISHHTPQAFYLVTSTSKVHLLKVGGVRERIDMQTWLTQSAGKHQTRRRSSGGTLRHVSIRQCCDNCCLLILVKEAKRVSEVVSCK